MLRRPGREQPAKRKSGNHHPLAQALRKFDALRRKGAQIVSTEPSQRVGEPIAMTVPRQPRNDHIVTARVELVSEPYELLGACRNAVKEHDRDRPDLAVQEQFCAPGIRYTAVVAAPESVEQRARLLGQVM